MSLSDFIESNLPELVDEWAEYASTISLKDSHLTETQLRNSARDILTRIAADMREPQTAEQQQAKSRGNEHDPASGFDRVAHEHADDRLAQGYGINEVVAEYRALRASVLRQWQQTSPDAAAVSEEMVRFNEAIDHMLAESVRHYAQRTERIRDLFAGVLAHDLRSPLGAILNSAAVVLHDNGLSPSSVRAVAIAQRGAVRMKLMIDDLLVFTRTRLGDTLPVDFTPQDIGRICNDAADEVRASYPDACIDVRLTGELAGKWDGARIGQLLVNLLVNAVQHGSGNISVDALGHGEQLTLVVSNEGAPIPATALPTLFDPLTRASRSSRQRGPSSSMGLGLYICRCIARAHSGTIEAESVEGGTSFTVQIPRFPSAGR
ncbi:MULTISPECIES: sensor histidine kinase [Caballeronia]|uniref:sensor histidine kinase n=1 Tax=Caballeronia TaxID=1827195 RepID=UPI000238736F|nr:sensor histidine kinase [Caballeronia sp. GACF5]AET93516.1 ATP-binding region, ATPase-like:Histidine kinase A [Burkholderia sp. YI23]BAO92712.1 ATP-binding region, ATPase-like:histidine kinase A [Burkholderia sp. RPE67]BBQ02508.1 two-component sensor histidine kinase [Burkholderia sp. SFA1]AET94842.1 ATP-binding region, ATPase-like:Histidine kinase A [Burkholderia sp. YI23]BBQ02541.1 two-component sensor histidine kinase [Burkholderia sp. SFA1]